MSYFQRSEELPEWVGSPPRDWKTDWLKWNVQRLALRPTEDEVETLPYISNEDISSWTGKLLVDDPQPTEADSRKFWNDDVLFNKLRPYLAKVYLADFDGLSSGELLCLRGGSSVDPKFLFYVLSSKAFVDAVNAETFGSKMPRADWEIVGHQPLPLPPLDTQKRITKFLDQKTAQIDALIEKKQALLERLAEKRQAVITQAVTKGLNPDAPMKDSGIKWFGQIPAHWEVKRLNGFCDFQSGKAHEPFIDPDGAFVCVNARFISTDGQAVKMCSENLCPAKLGDILMVMSDLPNGRALARSFLVDEKAEYAVNQRVCRIRPHTGNSTYLSHQLNRNLQLLAHNDGKEQTHLSNSAFLHLKLLFPPPDEQAEIAEAVTNFEASARVSEQAIERSGTLLQEYRATLITAAVTGQIEGLQ
ncbi:restriction endonuclease subunit S [Qipengyuania nanhaisediminis]|uniref:Type I restriction enzyme, S subunit n=1 Tax=Qipengyuania nanhaisediminis TaxID=604088 RepID=A0A1I5LE78_9SPHN|nr:restriction endonuclease subunit S [Qipengyuania nanhaisediminis]SFO95590.1 type I restriction enzyme, S subunit [Qipengyuania nanhaisediminis]